MMNWAALSQLEWTHPLWALLALQPLLMGLLLKLRRRQILHYADAHLLAWVVRGSAGVKQEKWRGLLNIAAWLLLAGALAGPRLPLVSDPQQQTIQRHAISAADPATPAWHVANAAAIHLLPSSKAIHPAAP